MIIKTIKTGVISLFLLVQFYLKMSLVGLWCTLVSIVFYCLSFPFDRRKWLAWAYAQALNFGVRIITRISVKVTGRENMLAGPAVITMNHQSNFDPLLQGAVFPKNAIIIGKKELLKIPFWGRLFQSSNNILVERNVKRANSRSNSQSDADSSSKKWDRDHHAPGVEEAIKRLENDDCYIWIFPEGTRSHGQGLSQFKRGAFIIAIEAQVPIIPMISKPMHEILDIQNKIAKGGRYEINILPAINTAGMTLDDLDDLVERCEDLYQQQLAQYV